MQLDLGLQLQSACQQMGVDITEKKSALKEQHGGRPNSRAAAEPWQNELADERLNLEEQKRAQKNGERNP